MSPGDQTPTWTATAQRGTTGPVLLITWGNPRCATLLGFAAAPDSMWICDRNSYEAVSSGIRSSASNTWGESLQTWPQYGLMMMMQSLFFCRTKCIGILAGTTTFLSTKHNRLPRRVSAHSEEGGAVAENSFNLYLRSNLYPSRFIVELSFLSKGEFVDIIYRGPAALFPQTQSIKECTWLLPLPNQSQEAWCAASLGRLGEWSNFSQGVSYG